MPLLRQACFCCCDLRTGVITISILCLISSALNLYNAIATITTNHDTLETSFRRAGLASRVFDGLIGFIYTNVALQVFGIIAAICSLVPCSYNNQEGAKTKRPFVIPFMVWCILGCIYSVAFMIWVHVVIAGVSVVAIQFGVYINILFFVWGFIVNLSCFQMLKENNGGLVYATGNNVTMQNVMTPQQPPPAYNMGGNKVLYA